LLKKYIYGLPITSASVMKIVFLVDDDADDRFLLREAIEQVDQNVQIIEAENGFDLLNEIKSQQIDLISLILLDMNMPKMNGLETIQQLKSMPGLESIPLVMITTSGQHTVRENALKAGSDLFLIKPVTFDHFVDLAQDLKTRFF
jgi:CheY-like chemotaxis protein